MLLSSLREVISNQAHEIQTLQKSIKDLTVSSKTKDDEVCAIVQHPPITDLLNRCLDYVSESPHGSAEQASRRRGGEEEGERKGAGRPSRPFGRTKR
jgi:hypothetical protein